MIDELNEQAAYPDEFVPVIPPAYREPEPDEEE